MMSVEGPVYDLVEDVVGRRDGPGQEEGDGGQPGQGGRRKAGELVAIEEEIRGAAEEDGETARPSLETEGADVGVQASGSFLA